MDTAHHDSNVFGGRQERLTGVDLGIEYHDRKPLRYDNLDV